MPVRTAAGKRRVNLRGCVNFRDLGGYGTDDGRQTRYRMLFRADSLHRLTPADQAELAQLRLATVIDLRTSEERAEQGLPRVPGMQHLGHRQQGRPNRHRSLRLTFPP